METISEKIREGFLEGIEKGRWPDSLVKSVYARASLDVVGTDSHSNLRKGLEESCKNRESESYGIFGRISYFIGWFYGKAT
jgi:hypothetical protein